MALISNMTIDFFKIPAQKYLNKVFLVQKFGNFILTQDLAIRQS